MESKDDMLLVISGSSNVEINCEICKLTQKTRGKNINLQQHDCFHTRANLFIQPTVENRRFIDIAVL